MAHYAYTGKLLFAQKCLAAFGLALCAGNYNVTPSALVTADRRKREASLTKTNAICMLNGDKGTKIDREVSGSAVFSSSGNVYS